MLISQRLSGSRQNQVPVVVVMKIEPWTLALHLLNIGPTEKTGGQEDQCDR